MDERTKVFGLKVWRGVVYAAWALRQTVRVAWAIAKPPLMALANILLALIVLFEEWGWRPLVALLGMLARFAPIARLEALIATLPPYAALCVFALPTSLLLPLKFVAMWLLANGHVATATALFIGAKIVSTALIARVFMLTKPALMRIGWFARAYTWFIPWKEALFAQIRASWVWRYGRMLKTRVKLEVKQAWARTKPGFDLWLETSAPAWVRRGAGAMRKGATAVSKSLADTVRH